MKAAAFAVLALASSFAVPVAAQAPDRQAPGAQVQDQNPGSATSLNAREQQAQQASDRDPSSYCQGLKQRAEQLSNDEARAKDHGAFADARDQRDTVTAQIARDCSR